MASFVQRQWAIQGNSMPMYTGYTYPRSTSVLCVRELKRTGNRDDREIRACEKETVRSAKKPIIL